MIFNRLSYGLAIGNRFSRCTTIRNKVAFYAKSAAEEQKLFWQKNSKLQRPLSPHLTIYRLPLTANMSIMHRATGGALSGVIILFGLGSFYYGGGNFESFYQLLLNNVHPHVMLTAKFLLSLPLTYHTLTGIRHLIWDTGRGLQLPVLYKSGYTIIPLAIISALILATL